MCNNVEPFGLNFVNFKACVAQNYMFKFTELPCILLACSPFSFMMLLPVAFLVASNRSAFWRLMSRDDCTLGSRVAVWCPQL